MPYTGLFLIKHVSANFRFTSGPLSEVTSVTAMCLNCEHIVEANHTPDLEILNGGVILYCSECGTRQVITNAHFEEFLARTEGANCQARWRIRERSSGID